MDNAQFDDLSRRVAVSTSRRGGLRLLAGGMLGTWLSRRGAARAGAAQRLDSDGDGLYDDDEITIYGTDPNNPDTDLDGGSDGVEVYNRDNGLGGPSDPLTFDDERTPTPTMPCPAGQNYCRAGCTDLTSDPFNCGGCDLFCDNIVGPLCVNGACTAAPEPACLVLGARCPSDAACCNASGSIRCCFNGTVLDTICTDTAPTGFVCPGDPPAPAPAPGPSPCPAGQTDCGGSCVDTTSHAAHCGVCFKSCPLGGICRGSACVAS